MLLLVLVLAVGAAAVRGGVRWQAGRDRDALEQGFRGVHAAFQAADCAAARDRYRSLDRPASMPDQQRQAQQELAGCAALERVRAATGPAGDRAVAYLDLLGSAAQGPLAPVTLHELLTLLLQAPAAELATEKLCRRNDELESGLLAPTDRARVVPALLLRCGSAAGIPGQVAEFYLQQLADDYPRATEAKAGARRLASLVIAGAPEAERRAFTGVAEYRRDPALGRSAEVLVYNQGPRELQVAALGPGAAVGSVTGCPTCRPYYGPSVEVACTWQGEPLRLRLPAGDYRVAMRYAAGSTWSGQLTLRPGRVYRTCIWAVGSIS